MIQNFQNDLLDYNAYLDPNFNPDPTKNYYDYALNVANNKILNNIALAQANKEKWAGIASAFGNVATNIGGMINSMNASPAGTATAGTGAAFKTGGRIKYFN